MINQYLSTLPERFQSLTVMNSLDRIQFIVNTFNEKYGLKALYNRNGQISMERIYAMGLILQLDGLLDDCPSPTTIRKHLKFVGLLIDELN